MKQRWSRLVSTRKKAFNAHPEQLGSRAFFMARNMRWRLRTRHVRLDRLLCGREALFSGQQLAMHTGDPTLTSVPISASPHAKLLAQYQELEERVFKPEVFQQTEYYAYFLRFIDLLGFGAFNGVWDKEQIVYLARNFINKYEGKPADNEMLAPSNDYSKSWQPITAYPVEHSDCYQVRDGRHRLAIAWARGASSAQVVVLGPPVETCLQQLLLGVGWNVGRTELYQPIESPEIGKEWLLVRRCTDRLKMMKDFLRARGLDTTADQTYIDLGCYYGWFVKSMSELGYSASGVDIDTVARKIGIHFYHLREKQMIRDELVSFLSKIRNGTML